MPNARHSSRTLQLLAAARSNPELAQRVANQLPEQLRLAFVDELARPAKVTPKKPGIKKCAARATGPSEQLNLYARSVARVS
jgi:hypothetical protein